jgi:hypothetical protein
MCDVTTQAWHPIDENTPRDHDIAVYAPAYGALPAIVCVCRWHPDAGFCVDEMRRETHWAELPGGTE